MYLFDIHPDWGTSVLAASGDEETSLEFVRCPHTVAAEIGPPKLLVRKRSRIYIHFCRCQKYSVMASEVAFLPLGFKCALP
jgi:hypothetical protein